MDTTGFVKNDNGKPQWSLLPLKALSEVSAVMAHGAKKYSPHNWRKGTVWSRYLDATLRHVVAFIEGEDNDKETGRSHLAHAICCLLFLLTFVLLGKGTDDRWKE